MHSLGAIRVLLSLTLLLKTITAQGVQQINDLNPGDIPLTTRQSWCKSQQQTCSSVCRASGQQTKRDTCDYNFLSSLCECDDGSFPDVSQFSNSLASLACNWQLNACITNSTSTSSSCRYQYLCGGRNPADALDSTSSTSASSSLSTTYTSAPTTSATDKARAGSTEDSTRRLSDDSKNGNYAWAAGVVIGVLAILAAILFGLWWVKRRRGRKAPQKGPRRTSSTQNIWDKQELDGTSAQRSELSAASLSHHHQMPASPSDSCSELQGSIVQPVELDGSNPLPQEMRTVSERLVRSNAYRSPISPTSPLSQYSWTGEVSPAASTINETMYK